MTIHFSWTAVIAAAIIGGGGAISPGQVTDGYAQWRGASLTAVESGKEGHPANCVWLRRFDPPRRELLISLLPVGELWSIWTPGLGVLRLPVDLPLYLTTECSVQTKVTVQPYGFSINYTVSNRTGVEQPLPTLQVPGHALGSAIEHLDHRVGSVWEAFDAGNGEQFSSRKAPYPESLYSPVIIIRDGRFALGASLEYDVLRYRHQVRTHVYRGSLSSPYGTHWTTRFYLDGTLPHGASRTYVINVWYNEPQDWIHTMRPYRKFLESEYGQVRYQQDMRPVYLVQLGDTRRLAGDNRRGFNGQRADMFGFRNDVTNIINTCLDGGYRRAMVRTCAGVYYVNRQNNFPPQIMTEWTPPMLLTGHEWKRLGAAGIDLLFWWGRSGQIAERWDDDVLDHFDPTNPEHAARMLREWTGAINVGASGLGLDKFTQLMPWEAFPWLETLFALKPDARFVAEPAAYDILNINLPTFLYSEDVRDQPHLLADFLVPGREMWVELGGEDVDLTRAIELIFNGYTIVANTELFDAEDLMEAVRRAQGCGNAPGP